MIRRFFSELESARRFTRLVAAGEGSHAVVSGCALGVMTKRRRRRFRGNGGGLSAIGSATTGGGGGGLDEGTGGVGGSVMRNALNALIRAICSNSPDPLDPPLSHRIDRAAPYESPRIRKNYRKEGSNCGLQDGTHECLQAANSRKAPPGSSNANSGTLEAQPLNTLRAWKSSRHQSGSGKPELKTQNVANCTTPTHARRFRKGAGVKGQDRRDGYDDFPHHLHLRVGWSGGALLCFEVLLSGWA